MKRSKLDGVVWQGRKCILGLPISFTRYVLTDKSLITSTGLFNLKEDEIDLYKISDKKLSLPLSQRIFRCGTIIVHAKDTDTPVKEIKCVKNPRDVKAALDSKIEEQRDKYKVRGRDMISADLEHGCEGMQE